MSQATDRLTAALGDRYRILRLLGQGGMASVYLAEDLKHDRKVAVKVLKPELAAVLGAERFVQEIKTTAALSHPHVLPLFDSGEADGLLYYVMPYIEGETIRDRLNREGQFGVEDAVTIARAIADALDYAHRQGIIHRDIKPENILLHDGRPMVMDFGIALAVSAAAGGRMTETGLSLGTPHYMSPEQATADRSITARSDVYSLASVLYEMLTGEPPHMGTSAQQIIMKIIAEPVRPATELRKAVPPHVAAALGKALEKLPADRFESSRAFAEALANPAFSTGFFDAHGQQATTSLRVLGTELPPRGVIAVLGAVCLVLVGVSAWAMTRGANSSGTAQVVRSEINILTPSDSGVEPYGIAMSPDGSLFAFAAIQRPDTSPRLYLRPLDERAARVVPGTEGANVPAFSPDGQSIAYIHNNREIRRIPTSGGSSRTLYRAADEARFIELVWGDDDFLYFSDTRTRTMQRLRGDGGSPEVLVSGDPAHPNPLPGGRHVLYTMCCGDSSDVRVVDVETRETRSLGLQAIEARYLPTGHLLLRNTEALRVVPFDARRAESSGEPIVVLDSASANGEVWRFALSAGGTALYSVRYGRTGPIDVPTLVDLDGRREPLRLPPGNYGRLRFAADGRRLAMEKVDWTRSLDSLLVHDLVIGENTRVLSGPHDSPVWTPDGTRVLVRVWDDSLESSALITVATDGSRGTDTLLVRPYRPVSEPGVPAVTDVSADGRWLILHTAAGPGDLLRAPWNSTLGTVTNYLSADWNELEGRLSPDGRWAAYQSNEERPTGSAMRNHIYVRAFPEPGQRFRISDEAGGAFARWSPDGQTVYYWRDSTLVAATVRTDADVAVTARRDLFTIPDARRYAYDLHPDGRRFVVSIAQEPDSTEVRETGWRFVLVINWLEEVRQKISARR